jgi:hypothetical protein
MGIEEIMMKKAEEDINDGTYIINLDANTVSNQNNQF